MPATVEFWFDLSCPYAYLASTAIEGVCARAGAPLTLAPMLLGGLFREIGAGDGPLPSLAPAKAANNLRDMMRWAEVRGVPLRVPAAHPMRTVRALRAWLAVPTAHQAAAMHALYAAYWVHGHDLTADAVIADALVAAGLTRAAATDALAAADTDAIKDELRRRTAQAAALGVFGAPALVVHREAAPPILLWGQDRLHWLEAVLAGWDPDGGAPVVRPRADPRPVAPALAAPPTLDFWFDYSSPFAYLGATQIAAVAAGAGATVRWRPMLLGALFRAVGTPDVPLLAMPEPKRRYLARDLDRWARYLGVEFRFSSRFPLRTVLPLRVTLLAGERTEALVARLFRAAWVEDRDVGDEAVVRAALAEVGLEPALVERAGEPATKQALHDSTAAAIAGGVFGAPTSVVTGGAGGDRPVVFWGQDRLELVDAALRGWIPEVG